MDSPRHKKQHTPDSNLDTSGHDAADDSNLRVTLAELCSGPHGLGQYFIVSVPL